MTQLSLPVVSSGPVLFRPIHYLGSKLRLVAAVRAVLDEIAPTGPLCDLFSGSGTISIGMAQFRPVISVDIQEYSRVLCSAMLVAPSDFSELGTRVREEALHSDLFADLMKALEPLVEHEESCTQSALRGETAALCDFVEHGSLAWFEHTGGEGASQSLRRALSDATGELKRLRLNDGVRALVTRHFGGAYFSFRQAVALDALLDAAHHLPDGFHDAALAPVLSTASGLVNTVGKHFAQPIRPRDRAGRAKVHLVRRIGLDRAGDVFAVHRGWIERYKALPKSPGPHRAVRADFAAFLAEDHSKIAVYYADPPYTRDHYSRFYHVLETMCLRDEPTMSTSMIRTGGRPKVSRGFYRSERHQSPFCIKSLAPEAFAALFDGIRRSNAPLVVSYSPFDESVGARPRLMSVEDIVNLARQRFRSVAVLSPGPFAHNKLNTRERNAAVSRNGEVLIVCRP
jgi:hypothetical protein